MSGVYIKRLSEVEVRSFDLSFSIETSINLKEDCKRYKSSCAEFNSEIINIYDHCIDREATIEEVNQPL